MRQLDGEEAGFCCTHHWTLQVCEASQVVISYQLVVVCVPCLHTTTTNTNNTVASAACQAGASR